MDSDDTATSRRRILQASAGLVAGLWGSATGRARRGHRSSTSTRRYFVHHPTGAEAAADAVAAANGRVRHRYANHSFIAADLPGRGLDRAPHVTAVPDTRVAIDTESTASGDSLADTRPWGIERIDATDAHALGYTGKDVDVAILDTGLGRNHADLRGNIVGGTNVTSWDDDDWWDRNGHGTHCAGIAAADDDTDTAVRGVAPDANLWGVKVLNDDGSGYLSDIIAGIDWCRQQDIDILSLSLGWSTHYAEVQEAIDAAYGDGHLLVAAAGNNGNNQDGHCEEQNLSYPAAYSSVVAAGAITADETIASFSAVGDGVELVAPGQRIPSTDINNSYSTKSGTSMAAPHVVGSAAVHLQAEGDSPTPAARDAVRGKLQETAEQLGLGCQSGAGLVRPDKQLPLF